MAAKKNTKQEKALQSARTSAKNARAKLDEGVAAARKKASAAVARAKAIVNERPVVQVIAGNVVGLGIGYGAAAMAKSTKTKNDETRAAGGEVGKFSEFMENPGNLGMLMGGLGSAVGLGVRPKGDMARKAIDGLAIGAAGAGMALKGADMFRQGDDQAGAYGSAWAGPGSVAADMQLANVARQIRAQLGQAALPAPSMSPATMRPEQTISAWNGPTRQGLSRNQL